MLNLKVLKVKGLNKIYTDCEINIDSFTISVNCNKKGLIGGNNKINIINYTFNKDFMPKFDENKLILNNIIIYLKDINDINLIIQEIKNEKLQLLKSEILEPIRAIIKERINGIKIIEEYKSKVDLSLLLKSEDPTASISRNIKDLIFKIQEILNNYSNDLSEIHKDRILGVTYLLPKIIEYTYNNDTSNLKKSKELLAKLLGISLPELDKILYNVEYNVDAIIEILLNYILK